MVIVVLGRSHAHMHLTLIEYGMMGRLQWGINIRNTCAVEKDQGPCCLIRNVLFTGSPVPFAKTCRVLKVPRLTLPQEHGRILQGYAACEE